MAEHPDTDRPTGKTPQAEEARPGPTKYSRRTVLQGASAAAAVTTFSRFASANPALNPTVFKPELFLMDRLTFGWDEYGALLPGFGGPTPGQPTASSVVAEFTALSRDYTSFLNWQLEVPGSSPRGAPSDMVGTGARQLIQTRSPKTHAFWSMSPAQIVASGPPDPLNPMCAGGFNDGGAFHFAVLESARTVSLNAWLARRQARAVMADFWASVHNTFLPQDHVSSILWWPFYRDALHGNALEQYGTEDPSGASIGIVPDSSKAASMLYYLNQHLSDSSDPIENYARELLELHTVGVESYPGMPTFTEADVVSVAKMFTGWGFDPFGNYFFDASRHFTDPQNPVHTLPFISAQPLVPLNGTYPHEATIQTEGEELIKDLVRHPLTALNVSSRLINWFLGEFDPANATNGTEFYSTWLRVALRFMNTGGDLTGTIQELFDNNYLSDIRPGGFRKIRRPFNFAMALLRATGPELDCAPGGWLAGAFQRMQQVPGYWPAPDGYPSSNEAWMASMTTRVEFLHEIVHGTAPTSTGMFLSPTRVAELFAGVPITALAIAANQRLTGGALSQPEADAIQFHLDTNLTGQSDDYKRREAIVMTFASPSFQFLH